MLLRAKLATYAPRVGQVSEELAEQEFPRNFARPRERPRPVLVAGPVATTAGRRVNYAPLAHGNRGARVA